MEKLFLSLSHSNLLHLESTGNKKLLILNVHGGWGLRPNPTPTIPLSMPPGDPRDTIQITPRGAVGVAGRASKAAAGRGDGRGNGSP